MGTARHVLSASAAGGMPVDARLWLEDAPRSSHPACMAVVAAREQGLAGPALRRVREGLMLRRERLDTPDALVEALRSVPGMDASRLRADLASSAILERFGEDLERVRSASPEHHNAAGRVPFPSFEVEGTGGVYDQEATPDARSRLAVPAVAEATGLPLPRAAAGLWELALDFRARPERLGSGYLWAAAT